MEYQRTTSSPAQSAQEVQDAIFRHMPAERKVKLAADFWRLASDLARQRDTFLNESDPVTFLVKVTKTHKVWCD